MAVVVFGAGGRVGRAVVAEAVRRGVPVTAAVRAPERHADLAGPGVTLVACDAADPDAVAAAAAGHEAAVGSLYRADVPSTGFYRSTTAGLVAGLGRAGVGRLVSVGVATTLATAPGVLVHDGPDFPAEYRAFSLGHSAALDVLAAAPQALDWVVVTPPMDLGHDGVRTGRYRVGAPVLPEGGGHISHADLAVAVLDEVTAPAHHREQIGVRA
ncbi:NAD(P)H-binding protein [Kitasatospora sp. NPDC051914]|uniref:NAD(P)-dependent oxidoreductase n=1 Tax=Kitasatospora sp. NPDC051914 TaxID=3154945 RepID=UPI003442D82B